MLFSVIWVLFGNFIYRSWRNNNYLFNHGPTGTVLTNLPMFVYTFYFHSTSGFHYSCKTIFILPYLKITSQRPVILSCRRTSDLEITPLFHGEHHNKICFFCYREKKQTKNNNKNCCLNELFELHAPLVNYLLCHLTTTFFYRLAELPLMQHELCVTAKNP